MRTILAGVLLLRLAHAAPAPIRFEDIAQKAGLHFQLHNSAAGEFHQIELMPGGVAALDFDTDGCTDLSFTNGASIPSLRKTGPEFSNRLYRNRCDGTFEDLLAHGAFGSVQDMPQILRGRDITWTFDTPITVAAEKALTASYQSMLQSIVVGAQVDPEVALIADIPTAARDAIEGAGAQAKWLHSDDKFKQLVAERQQQQQAAAQAAAVAHGTDMATRMGQAAKNAGDAAQSLQGAGLM